MVRYAVGQTVLNLSYQLMAQQSQPKLPSNHRVFHQDLLKLMHPTINWEEDEPHENVPEKKPTKNDDDVE